MWFTCFASVITELEKRMSRSSHLIVGAIVVLTLFAESSVRGQDTTLENITTWLGGDGSVSDPTQWTNGVPNNSLNTSINMGNADFSSDVESGTLGVGTTVGFNSVSDASLTGTANLTPTGSVFVGEASGTGTDNVGSATGRLDIVGGDISVLPVERNGRIVLSGGFQVGNAGGTGTDNSYTATGEVNLTGGNFSASILGVGIASGTQSADGTARGTMRIENGDINLRPRRNGMGSIITVGASGGTGDYDGDAVGVLTVEQGSIVASNIIVGRTNPIVRATGQSEGTLIVNGGDIEMENFELGISSDNGGAAVGLFNLSGGSVSGNTFTQGIDGHIVLGIAGPSAETAYGQLLVTEAQFNGSIEASFINDYQPQPGDVFDLVLADSITGDYSFNISGIDVANVQGLVVEQSATRVRISVVAVPEPSSLTLLVVGGFAVITRRRLVLHVS